MSEPTSFIKIDRNILEWQWYSEPNILAVFITLLLQANYEDRAWRGMTIRKGQLVTSAESLTHFVNLSHNTIRNILNKLQSTGEIQVEKKPHFLLITIPNYGKYQDVRTPKRSPMVGEQVGNHIGSLIGEQVGEQVGELIGDTKRNKENKEYKEKEKKIKKSATAMPLEAAAAAPEQAHEIPDRFKSMFDTWEEYDAWANQ